MKVFSKKIIQFLYKQLTIRNLFIVNLAVLVFKIIFGFWFGFQENTFEDWRIAENITKHGVYAEFINVGSTAYKLPVYPIFLSFFMQIFSGFEKESIAIAQHILYFFIPFLFVAIARIFNREKVGILTSFIFLFSPAYLYYSFVYEVTNVFIPTFLVWLFLYFKIYRGVYTHKKHFLLLGLWTAILFLTQVIVVPFACILLLILFVKKRVRFANFATIFLVAALCYSPWIIRNYMVFDRFVPTKTPFWQNIHLGFSSNSAKYTTKVLIY